MSHDDTKQEVDPTEGAWCVKWEKKHSQYKWSHFSDHLGENEGTHLSPKMKKKKKRTHGKYMACKKMNHCYHLHTVQPSSVPLNQEQRPPNTIQLEPIRLQTIRVHKWNNSKFAQYSTYLPGLVLQTRIVQWWSCWSDTRRRGPRKWGKCLEPDGGRARRQSKLTFHTLTIIVHL